MSALKHFDSSSFDTELTGSKPVMVDFYADWCAPCLILGPHVEKIAEHYDGKASVGKLNVDTNGQVAARYGIQGIPTVLFFKDGKLMDRVVGLVPEEELTRRLDSLID
jgi:thioredoxin